MVNFMELILVGNLSSRMFAIGHLIIVVCIRRDHIFIFIKIIMSLYQEQMCIYFGTQCFVLEHFRKTLQALQLNHKQDRHF